MNGSKVLRGLTHPIVAAPMGGGPSTPELVAAVSEAGGLGFLAAGYKEPDEVAREMAAVRDLTEAPFGVNVFVPGPPAAPETYADYVESLAPDAERLGTEVGEPRYSDDHWQGKLELLTQEAPAVVSFAFGSPEPAAIEGLRHAGCEIWVTVTAPGEARLAARDMADALIVQGGEAGAHQGSFEDDPNLEPYGLLSLLQLVRADVETPLVAAGGLATGSAVAAVLAAGASAAALGTAFMLCPEAGTSEVHREALPERAPTQLTRAFTGKTARGIANSFMAEHPDAPGAYPEIHYATAPLRAAAREAGDSTAVNLWAGQTHALARPAPAGELVRLLSDAANEALQRALVARDSET
jgi:nitronate monooxygenase